MVCTGVGKEFPDVRQNERRIKFIRVGDIEKWASSKVSRTLLQDSSQFL